jgi:hypothetical protein
MRRPRVRIVAAMAAVALVAAVAGAIALHIGSRSPASVIPSPPPQTSASPAPSGTPPSPATFRGIFQFTGTPLPDNAAVAGGVLLYTWTDLEPVAGSLDLSALERDAAPWTARGKHVAIRVMTEKTGTSATPGWVYRLGVKAVRRSDGTVAPQYWNERYLDALGRFAQMLAARLDGDPRIAWVQAGVGVGGETKVENIGPSDVDAVKSWRAIGYSDDLWFRTTQRVAAAYKAVFRRTPIAIAVNASFIGGTKGYGEGLVVDFLSAHGIWPQDDGLRPDTVERDPGWHRQPHIEEQYLPAGRTGHPLAADLAAAMATKPAYILVYGSDLADPLNAATLGQFAAGART